VWILTGEAAIPAEVFLSFPHFLQLDYVIVPSNRPWSLSSISFSI